MSRRFRRINFQQCIEVFGYENASKNVKLQSEYPHKKKAPALDGFVMYVMPRPGYRGKHHEPSQFPRFENPASHQSGRHDRDRNWRNKRRTQHEESSAEQFGIGNEYDESFHASSSSSTLHGSHIQHPRGLRGKAAADYWRNYGKMKKLERIAAGISQTGRTHDAFSLPSLYLDEDRLIQMQNIITNNSSATDHRFEIAPVEILNYNLKQNSISSGENKEILNLGDEEREEFMDLIHEAHDPFQAANKTDVAVKSSPVWNKLFLDELNDKQKLPSYQSMLNFREKLPAFAMKEELLRVVRENQVVVVSGETGCGKTTQLPQFILDDWILSGNGAECKIICTQPRRISAISVSERIASERAETLGHSIGFQIRLESRLPRERGSILLCTTGIALQWLNSNRNFDGISHIIVDEIHEQDIFSDFLLIILKDLRIRRPDLKIILMSATINAKKFSDYFGSCPMVEIPGYTYPVKEYYLEDVLSMTKYRPEQNLRFRRRPFKQEFPEEWNSFVESLRGKFSNDVVRVLEDFDENFIDVRLIDEVVRHIVLTTPEDEAVLIFLPGWDEIRRLNELFQKTLRQNHFVIIPLHSLMPTMNQRQVFEKPGGGRRKIVIATSIAETSITIDDIVHVIDCGKIKMKDFDAEKNLSTLAAQWISVSNARQRKGRAGRVRSGFCYRLYSSYRYSNFYPYPLPEIQRTPLEELCLQLKMLKLGNVENFLSKAMEPPQTQAVQQALQLLTSIGALDENEELTCLGNLLARIPAPPQLGKMMLLGCVFQCIDPVLNICAALGYRDPFCTPLGREDEARQVRNSFGIDYASDHILLHKVLQEYSAVVNKNGDVQNFCWENFLFPTVCKDLLKMKKQFASILHAFGFLVKPDSSDRCANQNSDKYDVLRGVICGGLYPNLGIVKRKKNRHAPTKVILGSNEKAYVHLKSLFARENHEECAAVFFQKCRTSKIYINDLTRLLTYMPVILFAKDFKMRQENGVEICIVDNWLELRSSQGGIYQTMKDFRGAFEGLLLNIYKKPTALHSLLQNESNILNFTKELFCQQNG